MEDSPGLDVGDGPLDDLADPVDALVGLFGRFAQFAVGGLLVGRDHSPSDIALVGDPSGGVDSVEQSGGVQCGHVVHGPRIGVGGPHQAPAGQDQDQRRSCRSSRACPTTIRGERAGSSRGRGCRPPRSRSPRAPPLR